VPVALTGFWLMTTSHTARAASEALPEHFAGEALTVAFAFALPALAAGAYLTLQGLSQKFGGKTLAVVALGLAMAGVAVSLFGGPADVLQRVGLASL
jgi:hypothetical protein